MDQLEPGNVIHGPAVIEHPATTFLVPPGFVTRLDAHRIFEVEAQEGVATMATTQDTVAQMAGVKRADLSVLDGSTHGRGLGEGGRTLVEMLQEPGALRDDRGLSGPYRARDQNRRSDAIREVVLQASRCACLCTRDCHANLRLADRPQYRRVRFSLYTPEGDSICLSTGIIVHVHTMSEAIKYMIRQNYEEEPCIRPGDIF